MRIDDDPRALDGADLLVRVLPAQDRGGDDDLFETVEALRELEPGYVSVTYGAGGSTRDGTVEISTRIRRTSYGLETMMHLSCVGETREGLETDPRHDRATPGSRTCSRCAATRRPGDTEFKRPEGGLSSAAELAAFISERFPSLRARRLLLPRGPPGGRQPRGRPRLPEDEGGRRRRLPDHPALLRQPRVLRLARRGARGRESTSRSSPVSSRSSTSRRRGASAPTATQTCRSRSSSSSRRSAATRRPSASSGSPTRPASARSCSPRGAPGIHFYTVNRAPATRAVLGALRVARPWERAQSPAWRPPERRRA